MAGRVTTGLYDTNESQTFYDDFILLGGWLVGILYLNEFSNSARFGQDYCPHFKRITLADDDLGSAGLLDRQTFWAYSKVVLMFGFVTGRTPSFISPHQNPSFRGKCKQAIVSE